ncbi:MAG: hypothetical protein ABW252_12910 [Polyangiales bacterium]
MKRPALASVLAPLRVLLPTWRFFDDVAHGLRLDARVGPDADALGPWQTVFPAAMPRRRAWNVLLDGDGNLRLAQRALLDTLVSDLSDLTDADDPSELASYAQVLTLAREVLRTRALPEGAHRLQVQIVQPQEGGGTDALLRSAVHPLHDA